jgi:hypothetical protein
VFATIEEKNHFWNTHCFPLTVAPGNLKKNQKERRNHDHRHAIEASHMPRDHCVRDMQTTSKKRTQLMTHRCSGRDSERSRHVQPRHSCHLQCHEELQEPAPNLLLYACTYFHTQTLQGKGRMTKMKATKTTEEQKPH